MEDEAAHGDGAQGEPEEALLRVDPDPTNNKKKRTESATPIKRDPVDFSVLKGVYAGLPARGC